MKMEKVHLEYPLSGSSRSIVWDMVGTRGGLEAWMADSITVDGSIYTFHWGKMEHREAELLVNRVGSHIRFHWLDEDPKAYFEIRITTSDLTKSSILEITEFAPADEVNDLIQLWEKQIEKLRSVSGM